MISGARTRWARWRRSWRRRGAKTKRLAVSHAFHSPLMEPMQEAFEAVASTVRYTAPSLPLVSNLTGAVVGAEVCSPSYWRRHVREAVRFADGMQAIAALGCDAFVELGPHPTLLGMGQASVADAGEKAWLPSLRQGREDWRVLLETAGRLYVRGVQLDWAAFDAPYARRRVPLPTYPFQRQRFWIERAGDGALPAALTAEGSVHPLLGQRLVLPGKDAQFVSNVSRAASPTWPITGC